MWQCANIHGPWWLQCRVVRWAEAPGLRRRVTWCWRTESAQFGYPEVKIGFMPAIVMAFLRRSVGEKRAFELLAMGDAFSASKAREFGIINHVYPDAGFDAEVEKFVAALASRSGTAVSLTKRLLYHTDAMSFEAAVEAGIEANALSRMTDDAQRGFERFTKKQ